MQITSYSSAIYKMFPTLKENVPWIDVNKNSKREKEEIVPRHHQTDMYYSENNTEVTFSEKRLFLAQQSRNMVPELRKKLIVETIKCLNLNEHYEARAALKAIGEETLPYLLQYIDDKSDSKKWSVYNVLQFMPRCYSKFNNVKFIEEELLPTLKKQLKQEKNISLKKQLGSTISIYETIVEQKGITSYGENKESTYIKWLPELFPNLNKATPWVDFNKNNFLDDNEYVPLWVDNDGIDIDCIKNRDKLVFVLKNYKLLDKGKLGILHKKCIENYIEGTSWPEREDLMKFIFANDALNTVTLKEIINYLYVKNKETRKNTYNLIKTAVYYIDKEELKKILLPKLKRRLLTEMELKSELTQIIDLIDKK